MDSKSPNALFVDEVLARRREYAKRREEANLFPPRGRPILERSSDLGPVPSETFWIKDGTPSGQCVRIYDIPGTLSGDILRFRQPLPDHDGHFQVHGDNITPLDSFIPLPENDDDIDDSEDVSEVLEPLPVVEVDASKHFTKRSKCKSEVTNLLRCQCNSCPGKPLSTQIVQLLGKSASGELVFEKHLSSGGRFCSIPIYKRWILDIIEALKCLHSIGIIHKDLHNGNLLFSIDGQRVIVCDLESRWGRREAPEVARDGSLDPGWTARSDIFDLGNCIKGFVYNNNPIMRQIEWPVPPPFESIVEACMQKDPKDRPTLDELQAMVEAIDDGDEIQS